MWLRRVLIVSGAALVTWTALLVLGVFLASVPVLGTAGSIYLPQSAGPFVVVGLLGAALAAGAARLGAHRAGRLVALAGAASALGAATILASHLMTARQHGAHPSILGTLLPGGLDSTGAPDETVVYTERGETPLHLDIYRPADGSALPAPVVLYTHGGGWIVGDRAAQSANLRWFADRGFVAMSVEYTLATDDQPTWDIAAPQVGCALTWIADHVAEYGGDPGRLFAFGDSAGGGLILTTTYAASSGDAPSPCGGTVPTVRAVAATVPAIDPVSLHDNDDPLLGATARHMVERYLGGTPAEHPDRARAVTPNTYITGDAPPTVLFLAGDDHLVPSAGAERFAAEARAADVDVRIVRFRWAGHGMSLTYHGAINQAANEIMLELFEEHGA